MRRTGQTRRRFWRGRPARVCRGWIEMRGARFNGSEYSEGRVLLVLGREGGSEKVVVFSFQHWRWVSKKTNCIMGVGLEEQIPRANRLELLRYLGLACNVCIRRRIIYQVMIPQHSLNLINGTCARNRQHGQSNTKSRTIVNVMYKIKSNLHKHKTYNQEYSNTQPTTAPPPTTPCSHSRCSPTSMAKNLKYTTTH